ncbi:MAG: hypothetical protein NZ853_07545 [Leptospiraceae bacterium]|nr:hypothetical protein [Leptospiraceae bacterium]MDW7975712.1 hypothetical protein [Leptospiraceae bacterium]
MHKLIFILIVFVVSCSFQTSRKLEMYFQKGEWNKILQTIYEVELQQKSLKEEEYLLWKARIYSLHKETYGLAKDFYISLLEKKPQPEYYYEAFLFLLDINDDDTMKFLLSGDTIHPSIIFDPLIVDLRNFLDCKQTIKNQIWLQASIKTQSIRDPFLSLFCKFSLINGMLEKVQVITKENFFDMTRPDLLQLIAQEKERLLQKQNVKKEDRELVGVFLDTLEGIITTHRNDHKMLCLTQPHFHKLKISFFSSEDCLKKFPQLLPLYREKVSKSFKTSKETPLFSSSVYQP